MKPNSLVHNKDGQAIKYQLSSWDIFEVLQIFSFAVPVAKASLTGRISVILAERGRVHTIIIQLLAFLKF